MKRRDFKGNVWRELCAKAIESNCGYSSGYHDRYALSWDAALDFGMPDSDKLLEDRPGHSNVWNVLQENWGVSETDFFVSVSGTRVKEWALTWDNELNQGQVWDTVREEMARGVTDADTYRSVRPEIAARYGLPGSEAKLHSGRRYDREHKYRDGAWDHVPMFDVSWEFAGRSGKHLCLAEFEGHRLNTLADTLSSDITSDSEASSYSNAWCQKLLAFIHECDLCFTRENIRQEFQYQVCFRAAEELHDLYTEAVDAAKEAAERDYWAERDVMTEA